MFDAKTQLSELTDEASIANVIANGSEYQRAFLACYNPNLSDSQFMALAHDKNEDVRFKLLTGTIHPYDTEARLMAAVRLVQRKLPDEVLATLRSDKAESVRVQALCHPHSDDKSFVDAVLSDKYSMISKRVFCTTVKAVTDIRAFKVLWDTVKGYQSILAWTLFWAVEKGERVDPKVFDVVHEVIRSGKADKRLKVAYARATGVAKPELLDSLKDDPYKPVIEGIAVNKDAWLSTQEYLLANRKSPKIVSSIAYATKSNELLNAIYHSTKSREIRYCVENNPVFVNQGK